MTRGQNSASTRREFLKRAVATASAGIVNAGPFFIFPDRARGAQKTLRILQWKHFVPAYDEWFDNVFAKEWGRKNHTRVIVDHVALEELTSRAAAEVKTRRGHDLVLFAFPPARFEQHTIDHAEIHQEVWGKQGQINELGYKSTYNTRTKRFFAFADSYIPLAFNYRRDCWLRIGAGFGPSNYDSLRLGSRQIREKLGIPCGIGFAPDLNSNLALHAILLSFGGSVQDSHGNVAINSRKTIEALKYAKALCQEAGAPDAYTRASGSCTQALIDGRVSSAMSAVSVIRRAERENFEASQNIMANPALKGPVRWLAPPHITNCYVIWKFARNKEGAKRFLVDLVANLKSAFRASGFCNLPCFPKTIPDLKLIVENDRGANPAHKYAMLEDALVWTTHAGYPGYATSAIEQVFSTFVITKMFGSVAMGRSSPEEAAAAAESEVNHIFARWKAS
jgi:multiple sugar transport system substrate-binding protein